jgi:hypothetical protein
VPDPITFGVNATTLGTYRLSVGVAGVSGDATPLTSVGGDSNG